MNNREYDTDELQAESSERAAAEETRTTERLGPRGDKADLSPAERPDLEAPISKRREFQALGVKRNVGSARNEDSNPECNSGTICLKAPGICADAGRCLMNG